MNKLTTILARLTGKFRQSAPTPAAPAATPTPAPQAATSAESGRSYARPQTPLQVYRQAAESVGPHALRQAIVTDNLMGNRYPELSFEQTRQAFEADKRQAHLALAQLKEALSRLSLPAHQTTLAEVRGAKPLTTQLAQLRTLVKEMETQLGQEYQLLPTHKEMVVRGHKTVAAMKGGRVGHFFMGGANHVAYTPGEMAERMRQQAQTPAVSDEANILKPESYVHRHRVVDFTGVPPKPEPFNAEYTKGDGTVNPFPYEGVVLGWTKRAQTAASSFSYPVNEGSLAELLKSKQAE